MPPILHKANFFESFIEVEKGGSVNLTVEVFNNMSLSIEITWSRLNGSLPRSTLVTNFVVNRTDYTSLRLFNLSFANDTGYYSVTAINECGSSDLDVYINVTGM